jgi:hypothetical protein
VVSHAPVGNALDFLWFSLAPVALSYRVSASCRRFMSVLLVTITVTSSAYATRMNLEELGPRVTPVRVYSRITRKGCSASAKSIMLSGQPCLTWGSLSTCIRLTEDWILPLCTATLGLLRTSGQIRNMI